MWNKIHTYIRSSGAAETAHSNGELGPELRLLRADSPADNQFTYLQIKLS